MGLIHIMKRGGGEYHDYKEALMEAKKSVKAAKKAIEYICELTGDMEDEYGYGERGSYRTGEREDDEMYERGMRRMR